MVKVIVEDTAQYLDDKNKPFDCGGGYGDGFCVYIDSKQSPEAQRFNLIHEVIENFARCELGWVDHRIIRIPHGRLDNLSVEILDALRQLGDFDGDKT